jgi:putative flippase GtrA
MAKQIIREEIQLFEPMAAEGVGKARRIPSYRPTQWALVNRALDVVDVVTRGRADWVQRAFSYLFIGGTAALVNLAVLTLLTQWLLPHPATELARRINFVVASAVAYEVSILANFIPNDYFTFRHLPGHQRSWLARCLRFHLTSIGGILVTFAISFSLYAFLHLHATLAQAIALLIAVVFNFTFHHVYTYRHIKH